MLMKCKSPRADASQVFNWWSAIDPHNCDAASLLDVQVKPLLDVDFDWCSIRRVSLGPTPHEVRFCRDAHTLLIFDRASFVEGGRWADGDRLSASGPLDIGLDFVPAKSEFRAWAGPGSNVSCTMVSIETDMVEEMNGGCEAPISCLRPAAGLSSDLLLPLTERLRHFSRPDDVEPSDRLYIESICTLLFREVLTTLGHKIRPTRPTGGLSARGQRLVRDYMNENLHEKIELKTLSSLAGVSRFHFTRAFKVSFGLPPYKYLTNLRMRKAADLLRQTNGSITDIALNVGFSCSSEFARAFKQGIGCTPREFRQDSRG